jgi:hypothetical protein
MRIQSRIKNLIILLIFAITLIGCGEDNQNVVSENTVSVPKVEKVIVGMTVDKAVSILGSPELITELDDVPGIAYAYKHMTLYIENGVVVVILDFGIDDV